MVEIVTDWRGLPDGLKGAAVAIGAFDGVHLIPVSRYRQVAARLEHELDRKPR